MIIWSEEVFNWQSFLKLLKEMFEKSEFSVLMLNFCIYFWLYFQVYSGVWWIGLVGWLDGQNHLEMTCPKFAILVMSQCMIEIYYLFRPLLITILCDNKLTALICTARWHMSLSFSNLSDRDVRSHISHSVTWVKEM